MAGMRNCWKIMIAAVIAAAMTAPAAAERCPAEDLNLAGLYLCYDSSSIVRFDGTFCPSMTASFFIKTRKPLAVIVADLITFFIF